MQKKSSRKIIALAVIFISLCLGIAVGISSNASVSDVSKYSAKHYSTIKSLINDISELCYSQMMQMLIIYLSGFTFASYLVGGTIIALRCALVSFSLSSMSHTLPLNALIPIISYAAITLFCICLSFRSMTYISNNSSTKNNALGFLSFTLNFLIISGSSVFMKILPLYFFGK